jgi:hypothetical protein
MENLDFWDVLYLTFYTEAAKTIVYNLQNKKLLDIWLYFL